MFRWALTLLLLLWIAPAQAQNTTCATRPVGDSSNACASTAFVNGGSSPAIGQFTPNLPLIGSATGYIGQGTRSGNTTGFLTFTGTFVDGDCLSVNTGNAIDDGGPCRGGGTVSAGTTNQIAYYPANGTTVTGTTTLAGALTFTNHALFAPSTTNWLSTYAYGAGAITGLDLPTITTTGVAGAARSSDFTSGAIIGTLGWGFSDNTSVSVDTWAGYFEDREYPGSSGYGVGIELEATNLKTTVPPVEDPYNPNPTGSFSALHIAAGGGCTAGTPCYNPATGLTNLAATNHVGTAILIGPNSDTFLAGITFQCGSFTSTDCAGNGSAPAIQLYSGLGLAWYAPGNSQTFNIDVAPGTTRTGGQIAWSSGGLNFQGLATTSSGGGQYLCIDSNHYVYMKASCP